MLRRARQAVRLGFAPYAARAYGYGWI